MTDLERYNDLMDRHLEGRTTSEEAVELINLFESSDFQAELEADLVAAFDAPPLILAPEVEQSLAEILERILSGELRS